MQVIPIFLGFDHCHPFQDKCGHDLSITGLGLPWLTFHRRSISILSRVGYSLRWHPSRLGPTPRQASPPTLKCQPKGVPDRNSHDPTDTLNQRKPFNSTWITLRSHQSILYLTNPGSNWGKYLRNPSWFMVFWRAPRESCFRILSPKRSEITSVLLVISHLFSPLRFLTRLVYFFNFLYYFKYMIWILNYNYYIYFKKNDFLYLL